MEGVRHIIQQEEPSYYTDNYYGGDWNESCKTYNHDDYLYHWNDRRPTY